jgi:molybdate transport system permease protein
MASNDTPVSGWSGRLFAALMLLFLVVFVGFALLLISADVMYINWQAVLNVMHSDYIAHALWLSLWTSLTAAVIAVVFAIPMGYALSRYRFPGHVIVDSLVDLPIVFPPIVVGLTLLVFFTQTAIGRWLEDIGLEFIFQPRGIVLCQFVVSASFAIRSSKSAFDAVDQRYENVALTLGCSPWSSFRRVSLPLAKRGILAGAILTWARAFGIFGPLMIFVGSFRGRTEVLSTTVYLEQSIGRLEEALAVAMLLVIVAMLCLIMIRVIGGRGVFRL